MPFFTRRHIVSSCLPFGDVIIAATNVQYLDLKEVDNGGILCIFLTLKLSKNQLY